MLADVIRSGVVEATIEGAVAVVGRDGDVVASHGDIDRTYYLRSAAKPFQAMAMLQAGAQFTPEELAIASASHGAHPIHVSFVESMLAADGLDVSMLRCPPDWPIDGAAHDRLIADGHRTPERRWHNCSGKHTGMLRACVAAGWSVDGYLDPDHPLQVQIRAAMSDALQIELGEPGVDGCGAPTFEASTRDLAVGYSRVATDPQYDPIRAAMAQHGSLTAGNDIWSAPSRYLDVVCKGGAEGCAGLAVRNRYGVGLKCFDGSSRAMGPVILDVLEQLDVAWTLTSDLYADQFAYPMLGGGEPVGRIESRVKLG